MKLASPPDFATAYRLALGGWACAALLQVFLYARPTPHGVPFIVNWTRYFFYALLYELAAVFLLAAPFLGFWLLRSGSTRGSTAVHGLLVAVLAANLILDQMDHEIVRFMGIRLTLSFVQTYVHLQTGWQVMGSGLLLDRGGPFLPLVLWIGVPVLYVSWAVRQLRRAPRSSLPVWLGLLAVLVPIAVPLFVRHTSHGTFRTRKVQPVLFTLAEDLVDTLGPVQAPAELGRLAAESRQRWLAESADKDWTFPDPDYPYVREPTGPAQTAGERWNVIYLQLESFRAWSMGLFRPDLPISPTPFLDAWAREADSAYWDRFVTYGWPTINGFLAGHCSIPPHSRKYIATAFAYVDLYSFPQALRRHGYRAELLTGADPDWDNERVWLLRWYDRHWFYPEARELDREVFRRAAERIRELGRGDQPFLATVVSITNHNPFRSRDPAFDIAGSEKITDRILNTMHYTDDVIREFIDALRTESWFPRTLVVVTGDHGYNLGEHDDRPAELNYYRESLWVPLILHGAHPRLPRGRQQQVGGLMDIAPTIADFVGIRERNPWQGHSLLAGPRPLASVAAMRDGQAFTETHPFSMLTDELSGVPKLFDAERDLFQQHDVAAEHPEQVRSMLLQAQELRDLNDHLVRTNRIWKPP